jgi:hypothetical protein
VARVQVGDALASARTAIDHLGDRALAFAA